MCWKPRLSLQEKRFPGRVLKATAALYLAGLNLPDVRPERGCNPLGEWHKKNKGLPIEEKLRLDPRLREHSRRYKAISSSTTRLFGGEILYQTVFDPLHDKEAIPHTLEDDLADIYCDVKRGLIAMAGAKSPAASVVWDWKFNLEMHWGKHAVNAIKVLHCLCFDETE